jgi:ADP-ribose pyrophosphatase
MNQPTSRLLLTTQRFRVEEVSRQYNDGVTRSRAIVRHPGAVAILPWLDDDRIVLIENYRISVDQTLLELPAGTLEPSEPPLETAKRELIEETGYQASDWHPLAEFYLSPGIMDERMYVFVARGLTHVGQALEGGEEIVTRIVTWNEAIQLVISGAIQDAKSISTILLWNAQLRRP